jgi:dihydroorotate dehydrogenase electron transfer subunit
MKKNAFTTEAAILASEPAGERYRRLVLAAPEIAATAQPGQFVNLRVTAALDPLLARPLGVFWADPATGSIEVLFRRAGRGTDMLYRVLAGERLQVTGPLGNGFRIDEAAEVHLAVGGGTGLAPVYLLAARLAAAGAGARLVFGFRDSSYRLPEELMTRPGTAVSVSSDAGGAGLFRGNAIELVRSLLDGELAGRRVAMYVAGPMIMMRQAAELAAARGLACQVSLESRMACGLSVCRGCVIRAFDAQGRPVNRTVCTYGPVFRATEVDWKSCAAPH